MALLGALVLRYPAFAKFLLTERAGGSGRARFPWRGGVRAMSVGVAYVAG